HTHFRVGWQLNERWDQPLPRAKWPALPEGPKGAALPLAIGLRSASPHLQELVAHVNQREPGLCVGPRRVVTTLSGGPHYQAIEQRRLRSELSLDVTAP